VGSAGGDDDTTPVARIDVAMAVGAAVVQLGQGLVISHQPGGPDLDAVTVLLILGQNLPLLQRRRHPVVVALVCGGLAAVAADFTSDTTIPIGALVALATLVSRVSPMVAGLIGVSTVVNTLVAEVVAGKEAPDFYLGMLFVSVAWGAGVSMRLRRVYVEGLEEARAEDARRAARNERDRIARELHDVVSHHVTTMVLQAEAAASGKAPGSADVAALDGISATGRKVLTELRAFLGVLRTEPATAVVSATGIAGLEELAASVRQSGLAVELRVHGDPTLPPGLERSVYRIVQESLTNVLKHAGASQAVVTLCVAGDHVDLDVADDGRGTGDRSVSTEGHGLLGIRERVAVFGGDLEVGPSPAGGFRVHARIPVRP
jgi:signal transduction histidine kinase